MIVERMLFVTMNCLFWNVKGLGNPAKRQMVAKVIRSNKIDIVCLEETKLADPDPMILGSIASRKYFNFCILNARGELGGFLIGVNRNFEILNSWSEKIFTVS